MRLLTLVWLRLIPLSACTLSSTASDFHGLRDVDNSIPTHINSTHYALQLFVVVPFIGRLFEDSGRRVYSGGQRTGSNARPDCAVRYHSPLVDFPSPVIHLYPILDKCGRGCVAPGTDSTTAARSSVARH
jgi:hypothetical protein